MKHIPDMVDHHALPAHVLTISLERYEIMLSTRPEKSVGTDAIWDLATEGLKGALERKGWDYTVGSAQWCTAEKVGGAGRGGGVAVPSGSGAFVCDILLSSCLLWRLVRAFVVPAAF